MNRIESTPKFATDCEKCEMESHNFWKNGNNSRPGRIKKESPKKEIKSTGSFQEFQMSVSDAWEMGDDEFCVISGLLNENKGGRKSISNQVNVIKTHSRGQTTASAPKVDTKQPVVNSTNENSGPTAGGVTEVATCSRGPEPSTPTVSTSPIDLKPKFHYPGRVQLMKFSTGIVSKNDKCDSKLEKFRVVLEAPLLNMKELKELSWSGIPGRLRGVTWRLLSGHLPTSLERRDTVLERKRADYRKLVEQYFDLAQSSPEVNHRIPTDKSFDQEETFRQIHIDVPRMNPQLPLFQQKWVQALFERVLFIWAIRHPASGYVQGINDLVTPFFIVFLQEALPKDIEIEACKMSDLNTEQRDIIEADSFWCLSKFLDCIQDNYIFAQLGIQAKVKQLKELIQRIDGTLHKHLQIHGVDYLQFSFRWMNNLLTRELPLHCTIRLWDTYLAESDCFAVFQLYVCAAFLLFWREQLLQENDFQVSCAKTHS